MKSRFTATPAPAVTLDAADEPFAVMIDLDEWAIARRANLSKPVIHPLLP
jgi:hypothetical protein